MNKRAGRWVLVTGASSGIGRALAECAAADGMNVVLVARGHQTLDEVAAALTAKYSVSAEIVLADLAQAGAAKKLIAQVKKFGIEPEYVINNAGFGSYGMVVNGDANRYEQMIQLNVTSVTVLSRHYAKQFKDRGQGRLLNVASTAAFLSGPGMAVYFATKAYVLHFSEALHEELRGSGVTVTTLCPGPTKTHFAEAADAEKSGIFRGKLPSAEEVARFGYESMLNGKSVAVHGLRNRLMVQAVRFVPRTLLVRTVGRIQH